MATLGEMLRANREARGLTTAQVEQATHIRQRYVEALEAQTTELVVIAPEPGLGVTARMRLASAVGAPSPTPSRLLVTSSE